MIVYNREERASQKKKVAAKNIKIVTIELVVGLSRHRLRRNNALNASSLRPPSIPFPCSSHLRYPARPILRRVLNNARQERDMRTVFLPLPALRATTRFALRDDGWWERRRRRFEWRRRYRGRVHLLFVVEVGRVRRHRARKVYINCCRSSRAAAHGWRRAGRYGSYGVVFGAGDTLATFRGYAGGKPVGTDHCAFTCIEKVV
ncbi:hypothetical protein EI94DRAFT_869422 [Lactarius quietus]|nr:hypothetical protein EI94DRAFT_869422 [Lactarius quietus]